MAQPRVFTLLGEGRRHRLRGGRRAVALLAIQPPTPSPPRYATLPQEGEVLTFGKRGKPTFGTRVKSATALQWMAVRGLAVCHTYQTNVVLLGDAAAEFLYVRDQLSRQRFAVACPVGLTNDSF